MDRTNTKILEKISTRKSFFSVIWFIPFISFLVGYFLTGYFLHKVDLETPNVIGKSIQDALPILSAHHLSVRLLQQREDSTLPAGIILDQLPRPSQKIRPNQSVFVTIATKGRTLQMPDFWGKKHKEVVAWVAKNGLDSKEIYMQSLYPRGICIAQSPTHDHVINNKKAIFYFSDGPSRVCIMPQLKGALLNDIEETLRGRDIRAEIIHDMPVLPDHSCVVCKITDQQPVAGAIVDMSNGLQVQLKVSSV